MSSFLMLETTLYNVPTLQTRLLSNGFIQNFFLGQLNVVKTKFVTFVMFPSILPISNFTMIYDCPVLTAHTLFKLE